MTGEETKKKRCKLGDKARCEQETDACKSCGWNVDEAARREKYLEENGLTLCDDGLYRLIIKAAPDDGAGQKGTVQNEKQ